MIEADILKSKNLKAKEKENVNKSTEVYEINTPKSDLLRRLKQNLNSKGFVDFPIKTDKSKQTSTFIIKSQTQNADLKQKPNLSNRESLITNNNSNSTPNDTPRYNPSTTKDIRTPISKIDKSKE